MRVGQRANVSRLLLKKRAFLITLITHNDHFINKLEVVVTTIFLVKVALINFPNISRSLSLNDRIKSGCSGLQYC